MRRERAGYGRPLSWLIGFCFAVTRLEKVASSEWFKVFRWIDGQSDWEQPRHINHGLDRLRDMDVGQANDILNE